MKIVITDVSVFFDLYYVQVLPEFFALDIEIQTTNFVYNEIVNQDQIEEFRVFERSKKLHVISISPEEEEEVKSMKLFRLNKSISDKSILWKAKQLNCPLLTCDGKLRKEAESQGIIVYGSIWVIKQLIDNEIINTSQGIVVLETLKIVNTRLPIEEIDRLIKSLK